MIKNVISKSSFWYKINECHTENNLNHIIKFTVTKRVLHLTRFHFKWGQTLILIPFQLFIDAILRVI